MLTDISKIKMAVHTSLNSRIFAISALAMGFSLISVAFNFYYVKVFLNFYHIEESWFQFAQTLFLVWNAINDPLFAYFQDSTNFRCSRTRRESVLYAAPLFALSFLVPWFPWGNPETLAPWITGVHLITALCFWDTMFTYVGLAYCCLFTEMTKDNTIRLKIIRYSQIANLIGSCSIFLLQYMSNQLESFPAFQTTSIGIAVVSCVLMLYCGKHAHTERELQQQNDVLCGKPQEEKFQEYSYFTLTKQILCNRDFLSFVAMNFLQEFNRTFKANFFSIIADQLIPKTVITPFVRSIFYGGSTVGSKLTVIFGAGIISRYGYYEVIRCGQIIMAVTGMVYFLVGPINHWFLMFFMLLDSCIVDGAYSLFNLPLSDVADNDVVRYNRRLAQVCMLFHTVWSVSQLFAIGQNSLLDLILNSSILTGLLECYLSLSGSVLSTTAKKHPATSMVYGLNALVVKPAISLSPMFVVSILNSYGYNKLKEGKLPASDEGSLNSAMFALICLLPSVIGGIQFIVWSFYTIREKKPVDVTLIVAGSEETI